MGQHGARQAVEGLPHRHRELDRRPAPACHRQPPEARLRQQGRDQAVLPRRGAALRQECRAPDIKARQRPAVSFPPFSSLVFSSLKKKEVPGLAAGGGEKEKCTDQVDSVFQVPNWHSLCRWSAHGIGPLPQV